MVPVRTGFDSFYLRDQAEGNYWLELLAWTAFSCLMSGAPDHRDNNGNFLNPGI